MSTHELRAHLDRLHLERQEAEAVGLTTCESYMRDLDEEISECEAALIGVRVTEIALARSELFGPLVG